ncbi:hypothetical protein DPMN_150443 [Dreissena polymorpha]|uniref:Uncharacterized protein n=1 Tax=Dreissena polymorpha TaxID=45954 RepID=A0A9D4J226_DREPO|nr:hypothetical protein DPMN_150443 [Dreissena polymorpha]
MLVTLLRHEEATVDLTIRLVSEHALARVHRIEGYSRKSTENYSTPGTNMRTMKSPPHNYRGDAGRIAGLEPD